MHQNVRIIVFVLPPARTSRAALFRRIPAARANEDRREPISSMKWRNFSTVHVGTNPSDVNNYRRRWSSIQFVYFFYKPRWRRAPARRRCRRRLT